jgi:spermidine/putrescine transport system ATP-binding protein
MGETVELDRLTMRFGDFTAVRNVDLTIQAGEFFSFLGPSGCGKTTILRCISGFIEPSEGRVLIGGRDMKGIGANLRPTALIFQNLALFPLMSVADNIAFGLEVRGVGKAERRKRAEELLDLIALPDSADKRIAELSGGQKQRVAIARALAVEPKVMLLDEPLSALDLKLRQHMRAELRAIQRRTGVTFIYITHDQGEAFTMSDRVAVMSRGSIEQVGKPSDIYDRPQSEFAATFVGENNRFEGALAALDGADGVVETNVGALRGRVVGEGLKAGDRAVLYVRPERLALANGGADAANRISARVTHADFEGAFANVFLRDAQGRALILQLANDGNLPALDPGAELHLGFASAQAIIVPPGERARE